MGSAVGVGHAVRLRPRGEQRRVGITHGLSRAQRLALLGAFRELGRDTLPRGELRLRASFGLGGGWPCVLGGRWGPAAKLLRRHPELHRLLPPTLGPQRPGQRAPLGHKAFKRQAVEVVGIHTPMVPALWCRRAKACGTDGSPASTLELTRALLLAVSRHLCEEEVSMRQGGWQHTIGPELGGRTLGLVGLGRIGKLMVPVARAFGMEVIAWSRHLTESDARAAAAQRVEKSELFHRADLCFGPLQAQ